MKNETQSSEWFAAFPVAAVIADAKSFTVEQYNDAFAALLGLTKSASNVSLTDFLDAADIDVSHNCHFVTLRTGSEAKSVLLNLAQVGDSLLCAFSDVADMRYNGASVLFATAEQEKFDAATGIYNRQTGLRLLTELMAANRKISATICHIGIAGLQSVNDKLGTAASDAYIVDIVQIVQSAIRKTDIFARVGDDEFLLVFPKCRYEIVATILDTITNKIDVLNSTTSKGYRSAIHCGILKLTEEHTTAEAALAAAEQVQRASR